MRRKPGTLLDIEVQILVTMLDLPTARDNAEVHGFGLAKLLANQHGSQRLTSHGTLYKALARLEAAGMLASRWEDHGLAEEAGRPRRRLYSVTGSGRDAVSRHMAASGTGRLDRSSVADLGVAWL